jgi:hypothetical protein
VNAHAARPPPSAGHAALSAFAVSPFSRIVMIMTILAQGAILRDAFSRVRLILPLKFSAAKSLLSSVGPVVA